VQSARHRPPIIGKVGEEPVSKEAQQVDDREEERQQRLAELLADNGVAWAEQYTTG